MSIDVLSGSQSVQTCVTEDSAHAVTSEAVYVSDSFLMSCQSKESWDQLSGECRSVFKRESHFYVMNGLN